MRPARQAGSLPAKLYREFLELITLNIYILLTARPTCHTWLMTVPGASVDVSWAGCSGEEPNEGSVQVSVSIQLVMRPQVYQHPVWPQFPHLRNMWVAPTISKQPNIKSWGVE